jgi:PAS domain-containing protein
MKPELSDAIVAADRGGIIRFWNPGAARLFGYSHDEAISPSFDLIIPEQPASRARYPTSMREGPPCRKLQAWLAAFAVARRLRFRRGACRYASLADLYCAFGMTFLRGCYHQILGPRRDLPKLSNGLCRHAGAYVCLNLHLGWQAAESDVERSNAFATYTGA